MPISKKLADNIIGRISGVKETDSPIQAARKAVKFMRESGFSKQAIAKAEKMIRDAQARGIK